MIRRFSWRKVSLAALCLVPLGCEPHHSWLRDKDDDEAKALASGNPTEDDLSTRKVIGSNSDDQDAGSFFKGNRRSSGGWSSEAREIENHLGAD